MLMRTLHRLGALTPSNLHRCTPRTVCSSSKRDFKPAPRSGRQGLDTGLVLGIESSCDDTGVAILRASNGEILGHSIASQADIHGPWGGVVPALASQAHRSAINGTVQKVLLQAGVQESDLDAIAVTIGPGLSMCLKVGVLKAIQLATEHNSQFVAVHHMEAHALIARQASHIPFPFLCLLVSGGHNLLVLAHGVGHYILLGTTLDDAVGEAFDKAARLLGLELKPNGGAALERLAQQGDPEAYPFTLPLRKNKDCNFSYAGLKTAVRLAVQQDLPDGCSISNRQVSLARSKECNLRNDTRANIAASFQHIAVKHLIERCERGILWAQQDLPQVKHFVVAGGVAANQCLRESLQRITSRAGLQLVCPPPDLCTDNGVMVAWAGVERLRAGFRDEVPEMPITGEEWLVAVRPRWPLTNRMHPKLRSESRSQKKSRVFPSLTELTMGSKGHDIAFASI